MSNSKKDLVTIAVPFTQSLCIDKYCTTDDANAIKKELEKEQKRREKFEKKLNLLLYNYCVGDYVVLKSNLRGAKITSLVEDYDAHPKHRYQYLAVLDYSNSAEYVNLNDDDILCLMPPTDEYTLMLLKKIKELNEKTKNIL